MADLRHRETIAGDEAATRDAEIHGESSEHGERRTIDGVVRTQRGRLDEISQDVLRHGHEPTDVQVRGIAYTVLGLVVFIVMSAAFVAGVMLYLRATDSPPVVPAPERAELIPPPPRLQVAPQASRAAIEIAARDRLNGYAWMDGEEKRARIPIERAMELLAQHGWPDSEAPGAVSHLSGLSSGGRAAGEQAGAPTQIPLEQQFPTVPPFETPP